MVRLESNQVIYDDGRHNAFTSFVRWKGRYWVAFRNGSDHRSDDGAIFIISSEDLRTWSSPVVALDAAGDNRDPVLYVCNDRLFVTAALQQRTFSDTHHPGSLQNVNAVQSRGSVTDDGLHWETPWLATEPFHFIWWAVPHDEYVYATQRIGKKWIENGEQRREDASSLWRSADGKQWERLSTISAERGASETAIDFLPDGRIIAFVRHDTDHYPELKIAEPPYTNWETLLNFPFTCNGPCLKRVDDKVLLSCRAFFEDERTPLVTPEMRSARRGLLILSVDVERRTLIPELMLPHTQGVGAADDYAHFPDISYADVVSLGGGRLAMSYYEGFKRHRSWIRLAVLDLLKETNPV